jgi:hypothetical protein
MQSRPTQAGGCLLAMSILIGLTFGIATGEPTKGALIGTAAGILLAVAIWLTDRRPGS